MKPDTALTHSYSELSKKVGGITTAKIKEKHGLEQPFTSMIQ